MVAFAKLTQLKPENARITNDTLYAFELFTHTHKKKKKTPKKPQTNKQKNPQKTKNEKKTKIDNKHKLFPR